MPEPITNLVLFHSDHSITIQQVAEALQSLPRVEVTVVDPTRIIVHQDQWSFTVTYTDRPYVRTELQEMAERFASGRPDKDFIATCDRRFAISWVPDPNMAYFNTWLFVTHKVESLVDGITLDSTWTFHGRNR